MERCPSVKKEGPSADFYNSTKQYHKYTVLYYFYVDKVVKDKDKEKSVQEELVEDMMALITSFSGKLYGINYDF